MAFSGPHNRVGPRGPAGKNGKDGRDGRDGIDGKNGRNGRDGKDGITTVVYQGSLGTGGGSAPADETTTVAIPSGNTLTVDSIKMSDFIAVEYFINLRKSDFSQARSQKMLINKMASDIQDTIYGRVGTWVNCELTSQINGINAELVVTNSEPFEVLVSFKKLILI